MVANAYGCEMLAPSSAFSREMAVRIITARMPCCDVAVVNVRLPRAKRRCLRLLRRGHVQEREWEYAMYDVPGSFFLPHGKPGF